MNSFLLAGWSPQIKSVYAALIILFSFLIIVQILSHVLHQSFWVHLENKNPKETQQVC